MSFKSLLPEFCGYHSLIKNNNMKILGLIICIAAFSFSTGFTQIEQLSVTEVDDLNYLYDEERLAHDIYVELSDKWELSIFENIAKSEKMHFEHLLVIYEKYGIPVPKNYNGFYNYPELNIMYDRFFEGGTMTLESSLTLAANFEEYDIADLERYLTHTQNVDLILVYNSLLEGSKNHLRAIHRNLKKHGFDYEPVFLEKRQFRQIIKEMNGKGRMEDCNCPKKMKKRQHRKGKVGSK